MEPLSVEDTTKLMKEHRAPIKSELYREWEKYFEEYNLDNEHKPMGYKLHMSCRPCYMKVYFYLKKKRSGESFKGINNLSPSMQR